MANTATRNSRNFYDTTADEEQSHEKVSFLSLESK